MLNILLIGNGAREHAIAEAIMRSGHRPAALFLHESQQSRHRLAVGKYHAWQLHRSGGHCCLCPAETGRLRRHRPGGSAEPRRRGCLAKQRESLPSDRPKAWPAWKPPNPSRGTSSKNTESPETRASGISHPLTASRPSLMNWTAWSSNRTV